MMQKVKDKMAKSKEAREISRWDYKLSTLHPFNLHYDKTCKKIFGKELENATHPAPNLIQFLPKDASDLKNFLIFYLMEEVKKNPSKSIEKFSNQFISKITLKLLLKDQYNQDAKNNKYIFLRVIFNWGDLLQHINKADPYNGYFSCSIKLPKYMLKVRGNYLTVKTIKNKEEKSVSNVFNQRKKYFPESEYNLIKINYLLEKSKDDVLKKLAEAFTILSNQTNYSQSNFNEWIIHFENILFNLDCKQPENIIAMLESWSPLLSSQILDILLDAAILPKLIHEVEVWDPLTDEKPIHLWVLPWSVLMKNQMNFSVYPIIREKLSLALVTWHPADVTARLTLQPWKNAFSKKDIRIFLTHNILPKLQWALSKLIFNPFHQDLEPWYWVCDWKNLISCTMMAELLNSFFFPKWFQFLSYLLNHSLDTSKNYEHVIEWYNWWKKRFYRKKLLNEPAILKNFQIAYEVINRVMSFSYKKQSLKKCVNSKNTHKSFQSKLDRLADETVEKLRGGFKDLVISKCQERDILFIPLAHRYHDGKQIFRLNNNQVYIYDDILFVRHKENWLPANLDTALSQTKRC